jgi:diaminohydroxyphosphoribosylaminopyrimidine deaminase/5-amino-6-(5-phosphoribosylamino)uracil reductase
MPLSWNAIAADDELAALVLPAPGTPLTPAEAKTLARRVAWRGVGHVSPNPLVGSVLVDRGHRFIAAGHHERVGEAHSEVNAFAAADAAVKSGKVSAGATEGGTLYVTLEPCAHTGRTPPCGPRVIASKVARVVIGAKDPNPRVDGRSIEAMRAAGIDVVLDDGWSEACVALAAPFHWQARHATPYVALKAAVSLDGVLALPGDARVWITGTRARAYGHFLRQTYDAVAVGQATLLADDPRLDARDVREAAAPGGVRSPWRLVLDGDGRGVARFVDEGTRPSVVAHAPEKVVWIVGAAAAQRPTVAAHLKTLSSWSVQALVLPEAGASGLVAPETLLGAAAGLGIQSVLLEGGAGLYGPFLAAGEVNRLHLFTAPLMLGSAGARRWTDEAGRLAPTRARAVRMTPLAEDWVTEVELARGERV